MHLKWWATDCSEARKSMVADPASKKRVNKILAKPAGEKKMNDRGVLQQSKHNEDKGELLNTHYPQHSENV
jgi:hypothetical protein